MVHVSSILVGLVSIAFSAHYTGLWTLPRSQSLVSNHVDETERFSCRPFLPKLFQDTPPAADHPSMLNASKLLGDHFRTRFAVGDMDSLSIAVVTADGAIFEQNYGVIRGNETKTSPKTTSDAMYRIASVSKLFTVLQGQIMVERGDISWEDPVYRYLPELLRDDRLDSAASPIASSMTLFELATHMSGLGRDWPPGNVANWPHDLFGAGPPPTNGLPFPSHESLYQAIREHRSVLPQFSFPGYSNTGTGLLGVALTAADRVAHPDNGAASYAELVQRDIFDPLNFNGSHFLTIEENKHLIVVPSKSPEVVDQDFLDAMNPAGGQFSSLRDSITLVKSLLNPSRPGSLITRRTMDSWLQTVHSFEEDDWTESGIVWEMVKAKDSNGRLRKIYWKLGAMAGHHAAIALHPGSSYGVVVLLAGHYGDSAKLAYDAFEIVQPSIDRALADLAKELYGGKWKSADGTSSAEISVSKGTLWIDHFVLNNTHPMEKFHSPSHLPLRSSEWRDEFRIDIGIPGYNGQKHLGCYPYWVGMDLWGMRNGHPLNSLYFAGDGLGRTLHIPAADVVMNRV